MPEIRKYRTWDDPRWKTARDRLPASQKAFLDDSLRELLKALQACSHPRKDTALQRWEPDRWDVPREQATRGMWVEYYLGDQENRAQAIICFDDKEKIVYLVARTVIHDHTALRELVAQFRTRRQQH